MRNPTSRPSTKSNRRNSQEEDPSQAPKIHERGDKVVVNGAKESLLSILKRHTCDCGKHTGDRLVQKFLTANRITASYDVMVWMFMFVRLNCEEDLYKTIAQEYLQKMVKKNEEVQSHQSEKYKASKKKTLKKFVESVLLLITDSFDKKTIEESIGALYSKGKSKDNALKKIMSYLEKNNFKQQLEFTQNSCSLRFREKGLPQKQIQQNASDNSEDKISSNLIPHESNPYEECQMLGDHESMSYWYVSSKETYDLFEELIQNKDLDGPRNNY